MSEEKQLRAEEIAESAYKVGRNPLDTAGMDTDDEIWVDENPDYSDYIEQHYQELKNQENEDPIVRSKRIAMGGFEVGKCPPEPGSMDTDDDEWLDDNPEYVDIIKQEYKKLANGVI